MYIKTRFSFTNNLFFKALNFLNKNTTKIKEKRMNRGFVVTWEMCTNVWNWGCFGVFSPTYLLSGRFQPTCHWAPPSLLWNNGCHSLKPILLTQSRQMLSRPTSLRHIWQKKNRLDFFQKYVGLPCASRKPLTIVLNIIRISNSYSMCNQFSWKSNVNIDFLLISKFL